MKMSPKYVKAQANMQAGVITSDGFLGNDDRPIVDIIAADETTMNKLGLDFNQCAERMRKIMQEGRKGLGEPLTVEDTWLVQISEARGFLPSPFEDGIFRKVNAQVSRKNTEYGMLLYSELSLHLFEKYHFLQGRGSPFRLEPRLLKNVLNF